MTDSGRISVAFLIGNFEKEHGGAQQLLFDICTQITDFDLTVFYMFGDGTFAAELENYPVDIVDLSANSNADLSAFFSLVRRWRAMQPDIVHTNSPISGLWGRLAAKLAGVPTVVSVEHNVHDHYRPLSRLANGLTLPLADEIVGVSESVIESLSWWETALLPPSTGRCVIYNGVNVEAIEAQVQDADPAHSPLDIGDTGPVVGSFGRHHPQKGYDILLEAFPRILEKHPQATLVLVGDGPSHAELVQRSEALDVSDSVVFTGYVDSVYPFVRLFDVAVFPSRWEGFGLTVAESMVARIPVVATDIPPFREVLGDAGVFAPPENNDAIATAVSALLDDDERRADLAQRGYDRVVAEFSIERTAAEYADLYRRLADGYNNN